MSKVIQIQNWSIKILVPGGVDGPGGVLVCAEGYIYYKKPNHPDVRVAIPRRVNDQQRGLLIITSAIRRQKDRFSIFLQSEFGDLYKVQLAYNQDTVKEINIRYFDTIPPTISLCVMRTEFLFCASEFGNHALYQFSGAYFIWI